MNEGKQKRIGKYGDIKRSGKNGFESKCEDNLK